MKAAQNGDSLNNGENLVCQIRIEHSCYMGDLLEQGLIYTNRRLLETQTNTY